MSNNLDLPCELGNPKCLLIIIFFIVPLKYIPQVFHNSQWLAKNSECDALQAKTKGDDWSKLAAILCCPVLVKLDGCVSSHGPSRSLIRHREV